MRSQFILLVVSLICIFSSTRGDKRLQVKVIKHQSCNKVPSKNERIRLPNSDQAPVQPDPEKGPGFYKITGPVTVLKPVPANLQAYTELKYGTKAQQEPCKGADKNGCGGFGSCCHCNVCGGLKKAKSQGLIHLDASSGGRKINCNKGMRPGNYSNSVLSFGMPMSKDIEREGNFQNLDQVLAGGRVFFLTVYLLDQPINHLSPAQQQKIATPEGQHVIGCQRIVGTIYQR